VLILYPEKPGTSDTSRTKWLPDCHNRCWLVPVKGTVKCNESLSQFTVKRPYWIIQFQTSQLLLYWISFHCMRGRNNMRRSVLIWNFTQHSSFLLTFWDNLLFPSSRVKHTVWPFKMGTIGCPKTSLSNYYSKQLRWSRGSVLPLSTQVRGFKPSQSHQDFSGRKNPQHAFLWKGSKGVGPMLQICGK